MTSSPTRNAPWLVVLADVEGLRWVLKNGRMAFGERQAARAAGISVGDRLFLYTSRGAFHNPTRDESRVVALAEVLTPVRPLAKPVEIAGRPFVVGCGLRLELVLPERDGLPFRPLVSRLSFIKRPEIWSAYMRSSLIQLPAGDARVITGALRAFAPSSIRQ